MAATPSRLPLFMRLPPWLLCVAMSLWPPFLGAGIRVLHIAPDFRHVRVRLRLGLFNRNHAGVQYGGSIYSMVDPFYALMLLHNLGPGYTVWDRAATVRFLSPGRGHLYADFRLDAEEIDRVRRATADGARYEPVYVIDISDAAGSVVASVEMTVYVRGPAATG
jgi:acyl-coenzyme A thioesterase PaaI-like protein